MDKLTGHNRLVIVRRLRSRSTRAEGLLPFEDQMLNRTSPFSPVQIGNTAVRFPSGIPIPTATDAAVDPYFKTRIPKEVQVEGTMLWPQEKGTYPGMIVLHERWGLTAQIKGIAMGLACEGYMVSSPTSMDGKEAW